MRRIRNYVTRLVRGRMRVRTIADLADVPYVTGTRIRNLRGADLHHAELDGANLENAELTLSNIQYAQLRGANLSSASLTAADLTSANLTDSNLTGANLSAATLLNANLNNAVLANSVLESSNLGFARLQNANLEGANLGFANLLGANLESANLRGVILRTSILNLSTLQGVDLTGANLTGSILQSADLTGADLTSADLTSANLAGANLTGANLTGANLTGTILTGANLTNTIMPSTNQPDLSQQNETSRLINLLRNTRETINAIRENRRDDLTQHINALRARPHATSPEHIKYDTVTPKNIDKAPASSSVQIADISDEELDAINNNTTADISNLPIAYDVIELAYISVYKYLRDDSGNVVFHFHNKFYTTTKDRLKSLSKDGTAVKYVCPNPGSMRVIEKSTPYLAGSSFGCPCGLLEMSKIKSIIETPTIQVLEIVPFEPEKTAPSTASLSVLEGGTYVSSSHCQEGQGEVIHNLRELPMHMRRRQRQTRRRASPAQTNRTRRSPRPCPEGKVRNPATGRCVNAQSLNPDARQRPCPEGKIRNPATGRCINDPANAQRRTRRRTPSSQQTGGK